MRWVLGILGVAAVAAGAWFVLGEEEQTPQAWTPTEDGEVAIDTDDGTGLVGRTVATSEALEGAAPVREEGVYLIHGQVVDAKGKGLAGIPVSGYFTSIGWNDRSLAASRYRSAEQSVARNAAKIRDANATRGEADGSTETDAEGNFVLDVGRTGNFEVVAQVKPPRFATAGHGWVRGREPNTQRTTIHVVEGHPLKATFLDAADQPVAGIARIRSAKSPQGASGLFDSGPVELEASSGTADIPAAPLGDLIATLTLPGRMTVTGLRGTHKKGEPLVFRVPVGNGVLHGTVTNSAGTPIEGADIVAHVQDYRTKQTLAIQMTARSDHNGAWRMEGGPLGDLTQLQATAPGHVALQQALPLAPWAGLTLTADAPQRVDLVLFRGGTVRGRITAADTDAPIAGASVRLSQFARMAGDAVRQPRDTTTNEDGVYAFPGVAAGGYTIGAAAPEHYLDPKAGSANKEMAEKMTGGKRASGTQDPALTLVMPERGGDLERHFSLVPGHVVEGIVLDPEGQPVEGARIQIMGGLDNLLRRAWQEYQHIVPALSGEDGRFRLANLPESEALVLAARKPDFVGERSEAIDLKASKDTPDITLKLSTGAIIRGVIVNQDGEPVTGANINFWGGGNGALAGGNTHTTTKADGSFEVRGVPPGDYRYWVWGAGKNVQGQEPKGLQAGEVRDDLRVTLETSANSATVQMMRFRITTPQGKPLSGPVMMKNSSNNSTMMSQANDNGWTTLHVQSGSKDTWTLSFMVDGAWKEFAKDVTFEEDAEDKVFHIEAPPSRLLRGTVVDPKGTPVPLCKVMLEGKKSNRGMPNHFPAPAMPGSSRNQRGGDVVHGRFGIKVQGEGPWKIVASHARDAHGQPLPLAKTVLEVTSADSEITLAMSEGETLNGRVTDDRGNPLEAVSLRVGDRSTVTDAKGEFAVAGIEGEVSIHVTPPPGFVRPKSFKGSPGSPVDIELTEGGTISGTVLDPDGKPLLNANVNAWWQPGEGFRNGHTNTRTDANGHFTIKGLPMEAKVGLNVWAQWNGNQLAPWHKQEVKPGTRDLEIRMLAGVSLSGTVVDAKGEPVANTHLMAEPKEGTTGGTQWTQVQGGKFNFTTLQRGRYTLKIHFGGSQVAVGEFDSPGKDIEIRLPEQTSISGRLEGADKGGWRVLAYRKKGEGWEQNWGQVKPDHTYVINVPEGGDAWSLYVGHMGGDARYALRDGVRAGETDVALTLRQGETITGVLQDSEGKPRPNVHINAVQGPIPSMGRTDAEGKFTIGGLPGGDWDLNAWGGGAQVRKQKVPAGSTDVVLKPE